MVVNKKKVTAKDKSTDKYSFGLTVRIDGRDIDIHMRLANECGLCHGKGSIQNEEWIEFFHDYGDKYVEMIKEGKCPDEPEREDCVGCCGTGWVITKSGQAIRNILELKTG